MRLLVIVVFGLACGTGLRAVEPVELIELRFQRYLAEERADTSGNVRFEDLDRAMKARQRAWVDVLDGIAATGDPRLKAQVALLSLRRDRRDLAMFLTPRDGAQRDARTIADLKQKMQVLDLELLVVERYLANAKDGA